MMLYYSIFLSALFVAMVSVSTLMRWAPRWKLIDLPDARKVHAGVVPRIGGIGMVLGTVTAIAIWLGVREELRVFLAGILIIAAFGVWDDKADLNYKTKFFGQLLAIVVVVWHGDLLIARLSFTGHESLPIWAALPLTVFFLLGTTNAMNLSDGLDGLAGGVSLLSLVCILALATLSDAGEVVAVVLAIGGAIVGFLRYNTHPATVFMGDAGSQFLGFTLGVLAVWLTQKANTALAPELPLLILGLPIVDTLTVMTQRLRRGASPFKPDKTHFHHKLLALRFDHYETVLVIYVIQAAFVVSAYLFRYESGWSILGVFCALGVAMAMLPAVIIRLHWRIQAGQPKVSRLARWVYRLRELQWLNWYPYYGVALAITVFVLAVSLAVDEFSTDVAVLLPGVLILAVLTRFVPPAPGVAMKRLVVYTCAILMTYSLNADALVNPSHYPEQWESFFLLLGVLLAIGVRYSGKENFSLTTSDFLVIFILLAAAYLPIFKDTRLARLALESAVMLYGVEFVMRRTSVFARILWYGSLLACSIVAVRMVF
jgi:UDP-GlcNAc:undecaprenyl-phosphate GlcNAc-1-phosphate transferase